MDAETMVITVPLADIEVRVAKGAALLDTVAPGWHRSVDTEHLEASCPMHNVLGQVTGTADASEQLEAVGLCDLMCQTIPDTEGRMHYVCTHAALDHGFYVAQQERGPAPEYMQLMAKLMGVEIPAEGWIPRDPDAVAMEEAATLECWRREIGKR